MKLFKNIAAVATLLLASFAVQAQQQGYEVLAAPQKTDADGKVEVIEFFWYGCPHCFQFEPHIGPWHEKVGDKVHFVRMAPPLNPSWKVHSQAYYAAEVLGILKQFHEPMFSAIHRDKKQLRKPKDIAKLVDSLELEVSGEEFTKAMKSFAVDARIRQAMQLARDYKISSVPSVIVNGKYKTSARHAGSYPELIKVLDDLVAQES